jgi:hypothetical protein
MLLKTQIQKDKKVLKSTKLFSDINQVKDESKLMVLALLNEKLESKTISIEHLWHEIVQFFTLNRSYDEVQQEHCVCTLTLRR